MGRLLLICRLAARDLRHRAATAVLLLLAITAASTTLTLGLALHGTTSHPYDTTKAATNGPDIVAQDTPLLPGSDPRYPKGLPVDMASLKALGRAPSVTGHSGPYPYTFGTLGVGGRDIAAIVEGRDQAPAAIDQPELVQGSWLRPGEITIERAFADALGATVGQRVTLNGRSFLIGGIAVTVGIPPYPAVCSFGCQIGPQLPDNLPGLIWVTRAATKSLATSSEPLNYLLNVRLKDATTAATFATTYNDTHPALNAPYLIPWQTISDDDARLVLNEQRVLMVGGWLLGLLALASVAVLVGGRMTEQTRRVGLLKAVGSTPGLVTAVLLAEHLAVALVAAVIGLLAGWLSAPLLTNPGAGLVGAAGSPPVTASTIGLVVAVALGVAIVATLIPAIRAARTSTVAALADTARPPRRTPGVVWLSARLPVPLLLGLRFAARRPRRALLGTASIAVTTTGIVATLLVHARYDNSIASASAAALDNPQMDRLNQVLLILTGALVLLSAVNAILMTWATVLEARYTSALTRALGATPDQVGAGISAAQALPALAGALLGIPGGIGLYAAVKTGNPISYPPAWWFAATVLGTVVAVIVITGVPAWFGAHRPAAEILQSELA
jgi:putative ABC transport system permease protein